MVSEAKTEPVAAAAVVTPEPEDQLGQIVKDLNEFISARMHRVKEAMVVADLIEATKVNDTSWHDYCCGYLVLCETRGATGHTKHI